MFIVRRNLFRRRCLQLFAPAKLPTAAAARTFAVGNSVTAAQLTLDQLV